MSFPASFTQSISDELFIFVNYLEKASEIEDPIERIKLIGAGYFGCVHFNPSISEGLIPLVGLTGETIYGKNSKGSKIYCELIDNFKQEILVHLIGKNKNFQAFRKFHKIVKPSISMNEFFVTMINEFSVSFKDGTNYEITVPNSKLTGIIKGKRLLYLVDDFYVYDKKNNLKLEFLEKKKKKKSITNWFLGNKKNEEEIIIPNSYEVNLINLNENKVLETGKGSYTRNLIINEKIYWDISQNFEKWKYESKKIILPSTAINRKEIKLLLDKKTNEAEKLLLEIDNEQKLFNKLRKKK